MNDQISKIINHPARTPVIVGLVSFGTGLVTGYLLARRQQPKAEGGLMVIADVKGMFNEDTPDVQSQLDDIRARRAEREAATVESEQRHPSFDPETVSSGQKLVEAMARKGKTTIIPIIPDPVVEEEELQVLRSSVFAQNGDDEWDYDKEVAQRSPEVPYVLHKDEYFARELGFAQRILTYYAGDDTMYDDEEKHPVYAYGNVVGELKFGHGSGDRNVFFVRNVKEKCEYEIFHDRGLYSVEVAGVDPEDQEDNRVEPTRFRSD